MCRGCVSPCATTAGAKSIRGPRYRRRTCSRRAKRFPSAPGSLLHPPKAAMSRSASSTGATALRGCSEDSMARILIAEDEESVRSLVERALALDGHAVTATRDGAEALDVLGRETDT